MKRIPFLAFGVFVTIIMAGVGCLSQKSERTISQEPSRGPIQASEGQKIPSVTSSPSVVDCGRDMRCFAHRADACQKVRFSHVFDRSEGDTGVTLSVQTSYEIVGVSEGQCIFFHGPGVLSMSVTEAGIQQIMSAESKTHDEVIRDIEEENGQFAEEAKAAENFRQLCKTSEGKNIIKHLEDMRTGELEITVVNDVTAYGTTITCVQR